MQWSLLHFQTLGAPVANVGHKLDSRVGAPLKDAPWILTPAYRCRYSELFRSSRSTSACVMRLLITLFT